MLFQNGALWSSLTVGENVALPLRMFTRLDDSAIRRLVRLKLGLVGMEHAIATGVLEGMTICMSQIDALLDDVAA